jgi:hypothetical protein
MTYAKPKMPKMPKPKDAQAADEEAHRVSIEAEVAIDIGECLRSARATVVAAAERQLALWDSQPLPNQLANIDKIQRLKEIVARYRDAPTENQSN